MKSGVLGRNSLTSELLSSSYLNNISSTHLTEPVPQTTIVNKPFKNILQAKVSDQYGNPVVNIPINFMGPNTIESGSAMTLIVNTDSNRIAKLSLNANRLSGTFVVLGQTNGNAAIEKFTKFTLTNQTATE